MKITRTTMCVWIFLVIAKFVPFDCVALLSGNSAWAAVDQQRKPDATLRRSCTADALALQAFLKTLKGDSVTARDEAAISLLRNDVEMTHDVLDKLREAPVAIRNHGLDAFLYAIPLLDDDPERQRRAIELLRPFILTFIPAAIQYTRRPSSERRDGNSQGRDASTQNVSRGLSAERLGVLVGYSKPPEHLLRLVISVFRELVQDEASYVRVKALLGLYKSEHLGEPRVARAMIPDLIGVVEDKSQSEDVRQFACLALGALGSDAKEAVPALLAVIDAPGFGWVAECALYLIAPDVLEKSGKGKLSLRVKVRYSNMIGGPHLRKEVGPVEKNPDRRPRADANSGQDR